MQCFGLKIFIVCILAYDDVIMTSFCLFWGKTPLFHYQNPNIITRNDPIMLKIGWKVGLYVFFKNHWGIFDFGYTSKVGSGANSNFRVKNWCWKNAPVRENNKSYRQFDSRFWKRTKFPFRQCTIYIQVKLHMRHLKVQISCKM